MLPRPSEPRPRVSVAPVPAPRWLSLGPASRLVGVDPDTLRRWADDGRVAGLRDARRPSPLRPARDRCARPDAPPREPPTGEPRRQPGAPGARLPTRATRPMRPPAARPAPTTSPSARRYRRDGRRLVDALVAHLDAACRPTPPSAHARRPRRRPSSTTSRAGSPRAGTSLTEAVALFVAARRPFLDELTGLGRRRALDAARLAALYENASGLLDRLLLRLDRHLPAGVRARHEPAGRPARR